MGQREQGQTETFGSWGNVLDRGPAEQVARGEALYRAGQPAHDLFLLTSGQAGLSLVGPEGRSLLLRVVEAGHLLGLASLDRDATYDTSAEALTPVRCYRINRDHLLRQVAADAHLGLALIDDLEQHRRQISRRLDEVASKPVPARLAAVLLDLAQAGDGSRPWRVPRHSHRRLAEMINAYRETVTKVLNQFRAERLLEIERTAIVLVNRSGLEELAQGW